MISVLSLAEPLAQMVRLVRSALKFGKQSLKFGSTTETFEVSETKIHTYEIPPEVVVFGDYCVDIITRFSF